MRQTVVIVLGMHRSGTSCLAGLLQQAGVELGAVIERSPHNPKGNREHPAIMALNEALLAHNGGSWQRPPAGALHWDRTLARRRDALIAAYRAAPCWGFKDPRTLLTLPFWLDGLRARQVRLIASVRHPAAVVNSLRARHPHRFTARAALRLWLEYNQRLAIWRAIFSFPVLDFDLPPAAYRQAVTAACAALGITARAPGSHDFFEPRLRRQAAHAPLDVPSAERETARALHARLRAPPAPLAGLPAVPPRFSVLVVFHDMRREAARTLHSLTTAYQQGADDLDYEVIAIDSGSRVPLSADWVRGFGPHFRYVAVNPAHPSPCAALNLGARLARGTFLLCLIDGARILSPGILRLMDEVRARHAEPFVYTIGMHLGPDAQNLSLLDGYDQAREDALLEAAGWETDGYRLFGIAAPALSSRGGFYGRLTESNGFALRRATYWALGGFDERFISPGGGLANLDFFRRALAYPDIEPVLLLGEATFHQVHGGVATNVPLARHPWSEWAAEYRRLRGMDYAEPEVTPHYWGQIRPECAHLAAPLGQ